MNSCLLSSIDSVMANNGIVYLSGSLAHASALEPLCNTNLWMLWVPSRGPDIGALEADYNDVRSSASSNEVLGDCQCRFCSLSSDVLFSLNSPLVCPDSSSGKLCNIDLCPDKWRRSRSLQNEPSMTTLVVRQMH